MACFVGKAELDYIVTPICSCEVCGRLPTAVPGLSNLEGGYLPVQSEAPGVWFFTWILATAYQRSELSKLHWFPMTKQIFLRKGSVFKEVWKMLH